MNTCSECQAQFTTKFNLDRHSGTMRCKENKSERERDVRRDMFATNYNSAYIINNIYERCTSDPTVTMFRNLPNRDKVFTPHRKKYYNKTNTIGPTTVEKFIFNISDADIISSMWLKKPEHDKDYEIEITCEHNDRIIILFLMDCVDFKNVCNLVDGYYDLRELCLPENCSIMHTIVVKIRNNWSSTNTFDLSGQLYHLSPDECSKFTVGHITYIVPVWEVVYYADVIGKKCRFPVTDIVSTVTGATLTMLPGSHPDVMGPKNPILYYHQVTTSNDMDDTRMFAGAYPPGTILFTNKDTGLEPVYIRYLTAFDVSNFVYNRGIFEPETIEDKLYDDTIYALGYLKETGKLPSSYKQHNVITTTDEGLYYSPDIYYATRDARFYDPNALYTRVPNLTASCQKDVVTLINKCKKYATSVTDVNMNWTNFDKYSREYASTYEFTVKDVKYTFTGHLAAYAKVGIVIDADFVEAMKQFIDESELKGLKKLLDKWRSDGGATITITINGHRGAGKTTLASKIAEIFRTSYNIPFKLINCNGRKTMANALDVAIEFKPSFVTDDILLIVDDFHGQIIHHNGPIIFVTQDYDVPASTGNDMFLQMDKYCWATYQVLDNKNVKAVTNLNI